MPNRKRASPSKSIEHKRGKSKSGKSSNKASRKAAGDKKKKGKSKAAPVRKEKSDSKAVPPSRELLSLSNRYLIDLEALREMFVTVLPVLEQKDKDRHARIRNILNSRFKKGEGESAMAIVARDFEELLANIFKLRRADSFFRQHSIVAVVSRFDEFLAGVLSIVLHARPEWLKSDKTVTYSELLELQSIQSAISGVVQKEIDSLMRGSHADQIQYLDEKAKLGINENFKWLSDFLEVTERRNLFVHTGGRVSQQYLDNCSRLGIACPKDVKSGGMLGVTPEYFNTALRHSFELGLRISQASYRRLFIEPAQLEDADRELNRITIRFLGSGDWTFAEIIADFHVAIPEKFRGPSEDHYYAIINRAIAQKFAGKEYKTGLKGPAWDAFHPKYQLALEVLDDDFAKAEATMQNQAVKEAVEKTGFRTWPLFRKFRGSPEFARAYQKMFKAKYVPDPERDVADLEKAVSGSDKRSPSAA